MELSVPTPVRFLVRPIFNNKIEWVENKGLPHYQPLYCSFIHSIIEIKSSGSNVKGYLTIGVNLPFIIAYPFGFPFCKMDRTEEDYLEKISVPIR